MSQETVADVLARLTELRDQRSLALESVEEKFEEMWVLNEEIRALGVSVRSKPDENGLCLRFDDVNTVSGAERCAFGVGVCRVEEYNHEELGERCRVVHEEWRTRAKAFGVAKKAYAVALLAEIGEAP